MNVTNLQLKSGEENLNKAVIVFSNEDRFKNFNNLPRVTTCKFCGKELYTKGICISPNKVTWFQTPEPCNCEKAMRCIAEQIMKKENEALEIKRLKLNRNLNKSILKLFGESGLSLRARECIFEKYIITEQNQKAYYAGKNFIEKFNKDNQKKSGLFIAGNIGVGKSFLAFCIANHLLLKGHSVIVTTPEDLLNSIRHTYYKEGKTEHEILKIYKDVELLILDDIGKEQLSEWGIAKLNNILYHRHENFKSIILTSNYNDDLLIKRISPDNDLTTAKAILDRLYQTCKSIIITGNSWRSKNV